MLVGLKKGSFLQGRYKRDVNAFTFVEFVQGYGLRRRGKVCEKVA